jgi:uncharacterized protein (DUF697 family)
MNREEIADRVIQDHVFYAAAGGVLPIPVLDVAAVTAIQIDLVRALARIFEVPFDAATGKGVILSLTGASAARLGASAVKVLAGVGTVVGGATQAALAGASTYAVGHLFRNHFAEQGTLADLDPEESLPVYRALLERGKEAVGSFRRSPKRSIGETTELLRRLGVLRADAVITQEEFERLKAEVMAVA